MIVQDRPIITGLEQKLQFSGMSCATERPSAPGPTRQGPQPRPVDRIHPASSDDVGPSRLCSARSIGDHVLALRRRQRPVAVLTSDRVGVDGIGLCSLDQARHTPWWICRPGARSSSRVGRGGYRRLSTRGLWPWLHATGRGPALCCRGDTAGRRNGLGRGPRLQLRPRLPRLAFASDQPSRWAPTRPATLQRWPPLHRPPPGWASTNEASRPRSQPAAPTPGSPPVQTGPTPAPRRPTPPTSTAR
jgi:hypothetical protein